ncbi:MAG: hypothetical protein UR68_C0015G0026 [Candidatus Roizmanbacteria bacterium GW2011_GWA2_35_19]|uniref:Uncharacterized protein n=1 Tax=Candidatus Roizmanbacteria bacterium GW2011_GWA2_35_19 TaxID=1618478 RepID=A0A0G0EB40_9BACT|nr:MAG: hypothetical protein UR68_C0015G0026 [Candidatus Roizmanbacteria bacterium GW2011_GWA2_35_19]
MSDTILSGDFTVYYSAENRQKRIVWTGSATGTRTVNQLYSALQDLFDELTQLDDGVPMSAQTPTEYTIGIVDPGDKDPWFIDRTTVEHLTGGALKTASWDRVQDSNVGIVKVVCNNTSIVSGDIGMDISIDAGDAGTLLDVKGTGAGSELWIRPDTYAVGNSWDSGTTITCNAHTATFTSVTSAGESLWANIYTLGTIESNTHIYIQQNPTATSPLLVAYKGTSDWWEDGHIDILVNVKELGTETDEGWIYVFARQYSKTYSYYSVDLTNGGRNPIPLQTGNDLDNQTGFRETDMATSSGTFVDGEVFDDDATGLKKAVVTSWNETTKVLQYYLIGDPISDFSNGDAITGVTSLATGTVVTPTDIGPAALSPVPTVTFGGLTTGGSYDIDEDGTAENYSIVLDCISATNHRVTTMYEWTKYLTRRGNSADIVNGTPVQQGQFYVGSEYRIRYSGSVTGGTIDDGDKVTQETSGAIGYVVNHNTTDKIIVLRNTRGTFATHATTHTLSTVGGGGGSVEVDTEASAIAPITAAPFGTFAGGKFFLAPGVVLANFHSLDLNNFQLVDDNGTVRVAPTKVYVTVNNVLTDDKIAVFRLTGSSGDIEKNYYSCTAQSAEATTVVVGETIRVDEPGKTTGGILRIVDNNADPTLTKEYRLRFSSWLTSTFTLASATLTPEAGTNTTTVVDTGAFTAALCKVGDLIYNVTLDAYSYVVSRDSDDQVTISPAIASQTNTDTIKKNVLPAAVTTADDVYVPFIDVKALSDGSEQVQVVYSATVYTRVRARRSGALSNRILPFEQDSTIGTSGMTVSVIRTPDTIVT